MYLGIEKEPNKDLKPFCYWLIQKIEKTLVSSIDKKRCRRFDKFFETLGMKNTTYILLLQATRQLMVREYKDYYSIEFSDKKIDNISYKQIIKLVTYGVTKEKGYPIFEDILNYYAANLSDYFKLYKRSFR